MKNRIHFSNLMILLLAFSIAGYGQYSQGNPNVAGLKYATASDSVGIHVPGQAVDGLSGTWATIPGAAPVFLQVDLGDIYTIDGYGMELTQVGELPLGYTIQGSLNGSTWYDLHTGSNSGIGTFTYDFSQPYQFRYVKIDITSSSIPASISEFYVYGFKLEPPAPPVVAGEPTNVTSGSFTANWSKRNGATGYILDVALASDFKDYVPGYKHLDVGDVASRAVTGLSATTDYYYRVVTYNLAGQGDPSNWVLVTTLRLPQTITFNAIPGKTYGGGDFALTASASSGLIVSYASSDESIATISGNTVTIVGVGTTTITASQDGDSEYLPASSVDQDLVVGKKALTVSGAAAENKVYDGNTTAAISGASLVGVVGTDVVSVSGAAIGAFAQEDVGSGIAVSTTISLSGADKDNYTLSQPTGITANITAKELTVSGAVAANKVYDATTVATVSGASLVGIVGLDVVDLVDATGGIFAQVNTGTGIAVSTSMSIGGADKANYSFTAPTGLTADITQKELTVTADNASREECSGNPLFTKIYSGFVGVEDANVLTSEPKTLTLANEASPAGTYDITVSGGMDNNYSFLFVSGILTITADATAPELTVKNATIKLDETGNASITPADLVESASDNCSLADTTLSQSTFAIGDKGDVVVNVTVSDAAGNETSLPAVVTVEGATGLDDLSGINARIYPNPTDGMVQLEMNARAERLKVMDMTGKTIIYRSSLEPQEIIDLSGYSKGVYIFQLEIGEDIRHFRVIKK